ncbi:hypothetical protein LOS25_16530 [Enterococcus faecium]|nr:hypothetical protein [Enterococcus faecium]
MAVKINDLTLPKEKLENEYQVVQVSFGKKTAKRWAGRMNVFFQNSDLKKISVKVKSEAPVITKETLDEKGMAIVRFDNLMITPWGRKMDNLLAMD